MHPYYIIMMSLAYATKRHSPNNIYSRLHCKKKRCNTEPLRFRAVLPNYFKFRDTKMIPLHSYETILSSGYLQKFRNLTMKPTRSFVEHMQNFQWFRLISKSSVETVLNHSWFRNCSKVSHIVYKTSHSSAAHIRNYFVIYKVINSFVSAILNLQMCYETSIGFVTYVQNPV